MSVCKRIVCLCLCGILLMSFCPKPALGAQASALGYSSFSGVSGPTLVKRGSTWYYIKNGAVCYDTTLVKFSGSWYYVKNGTTQPSVTTLVKYNGSWWYVVKGKVASNTTTLVKYNGEWWYVVKGKIASNTTSLVKYNGGWYYIYKGKLAAKTTTLVKYAGKWYYVENGKVNFSAETLVPFSGQRYYVKDGVAYTHYTGYIQYRDQRLYLRKGAVSTPPDSYIDRQIPSDAFVYQGHCYKVYVDVCDTWEDAYKYCVLLGGHLATITSQEENDAVYAYVLSTGHRNAYFGYSDHIQEGTWEWVTEETAAYTNWHAGEPNAERLENYAMFYWKFSNGQWNDGNFGRGTQADDRIFICEWD